MLFTKGISQFRRPVPGLYTFDVYSFPLQSEEEVEALLREEVCAASLRLETAKAEFRRIAAQVTNASEEASSSHAVAEAAASQNRAMEALAMALGQFSCFLGTRASGRATAGYQASAEVSQPV